jgi:hypothetical protein
MLLLERRTVLRAFSAPTVHKRKQPPRKSIGSYVSEGSIEHNDSVITAVTTMDNNSKDRLA